MFRYNRLNNFNKVEHPSLPIYALRKEGRLEEAYDIALRLYQQDSTNDEINKAFSWVLIDLCKKYISEQNLDTAQTYLNQLFSIQFENKDDFVKTINTQIKMLKSIIDENYSDIQKAEELSKNGSNKEALTIFKNLISQNKLSEVHHESYGWIIYRYIKAEESNLSSVEVRTFLRDYMNLMNEKPSMLHSMILNFALNYSKTHSDFKFYNFFLLWNPDNLRHEDLYNGYKDGNDIPSLISRICKEIVNSTTEFNLEEFLSKIKLKKETILDFFREPIFWNIFNTHKEDKFSELWILFDQYNNKYSKHGQSKWHSEILNLAKRFMKENDEWRFLNFFKNWNPENLRPDDWKETKKEEQIFEPLATAAIKKAYKILKAQTSEQDLSWLIKLYETAIELFPNDEWLLREKALLHFKNNELDLAIKIYKKLVLELADKYYVWQELSNCIVSDHSLKIGVLSKALSLEKNEDFLGEIHLDLAKALIAENLMENALIELESYKKYREIKGWNVSAIYYELHKSASVVNLSLEGNEELYKNHIPIAEKFAYADLDWTEVVLVDKWKDDRGKERLTLTDGKTIEFAIRKNRFEILKQSELGQIFKCKLHKQEYKYIPLLIEKTEKHNWEILEDSFAFVEYINKETNIIHAITSDNKEAFFPQIKSELKIGDFVKAKIYTKKENNRIRTELREIQKVDKGYVISKFQTQIAIVDGVNEQKQLFHFVISSKLQGVVKYSETNHRPNEGDFIKLSYATKTDQNNKIRVQIVDIEPTEEANSNLRKDITGLLEVKYKNGNYPDYDFDEDEEFTDSAFDENGKLIINNKPIPDFAFIGDYYVPKYLLEKHNITGDCRVNARAIYAGDKWKVINIQKI